MLAAAGGDAVVAVTFDILACFFIVCWNNLNIMWIGRVQVGDRQSIKKRQQIVTDVDPLCCMYVY